MEKSENCEILLRDILSRVCRIESILTLQNTSKTVLDTCEVLANVPGKKYKCSNCSYSTNYKSNLNKHQKTKKCQAVEVEEEEEEEDTVGCYLENSYSIEPPKLHEEKFDTEHPLLPSDIEELAQAFLHGCGIRFGQENNRPRMACVTRSLFQTVLKDHNFSMGSNGDVIYFNGNKVDFAYFRHIFELCKQVGHKATDLVDDAFEKDCLFKHVDVSRIGHWEIFENMLPLAKQRRDITRAQKKVEKTTRTTYLSLHCYLKQHKAWYEQKQKFKSMNQQRPKTKVV